ncbi:MAG: diphthine synthase [Candidatus Aenigmarchaeota archaeon]|nr:diphthine synthase [Candidatus Aenigmarchaeota archaeon]
MLNLIGLGLNNENSITLEGLELCRKSDKIYLETYTSKWNGSLEDLAKVVGKEIIKLERSDLEENSDKILFEAKEKKISVLILGDPLVATTHTSLLLEAKKNGIETHIIHNASIYSTVSETGLHLYKFGATVTIPFPEKISNETPKSIYKTIDGNIERGLHTLCLLDLISEENKFMSPKQGIEILLGSDNISEERELVVFGRSGTEKPFIIYGKIKELLTEDFGDPPFVLILPESLHFTEQEYLSYYRVD